MAYNSLAGILAANQERQQDIQGAQGVATLAGMLEAQKKKKSFDADLMALGPEATDEQRIGVAYKHADPAALLHYGAASQDRKANLTAQTENRRLALEQLKATKEQENAVRLSTAATAEARAAESERHNRTMEPILAALAKTKAETGEKPPSGYRKTGEGNLEAIPGGPADTKLQGQLNTDTAMLQGSQADLDRLQAEANRLLKHPGLSKTTGFMSAVPGIGGTATIPGTDAANFKAGLDSMKSQVGFSVLQTMRNNSKTGGALGQVSDMENKLLQANLASLDRAQSEPEFRAALQKIITYTDAAKDRLRNAYNLKHGDKKPVKPETLKFDAQGNPL